MANKIIVAGIGPGNPDYVAPEALRVIRGAGVLIGGRRALSQFAGPAVREQFVIGGDIPAVMAFIREKLRGSDVVVMVSGDPGYYSLLDALRREFAADALQVIPGISSVQMAFARLALPWQAADLWSFHGRAPEEDRLAYAPGRIAGMLTDDTYDSHRIPRLLLEKGWPGETGLAICSRLSYEDEVVIRTTLAEAENYPAYSHCVLVVTA